MAAKKSFENLCGVASLCNILSNENLLISPRKVSRPSRVHHRYYEVHRTETTRTAEDVARLDEDVVIRVKKLREEAWVPKRAKPGDAAFDLYSIEEYELEPGERAAVCTGIAVEIPEGYEGQVRPRSGLAIKHGITVLNAPGTIDSGYRGEVKTIMVNHGTEPFKVEKGMRISQLAIRPVPRVEIALVDELSDSDRGNGGFGSTGV
ncbi:dUTP diphosphatase [Candidatus Thorarchaeota archaeon]|nr:MAG: dUTP diphosphatase [Candidatus Thorarchaeota archaeon]